MAAVAASSVFGVDAADPADAAVALPCDGSSPSESENTGSARLLYHTVYQFFSLGWTLLGHNRLFEAVHPRSVLVGCQSDLQERFWGLAKLLAPILHNILCLLNHGSRLAQDLEAKLNG